MAVSGVASGPINPIVATFIQGRVVPHERARAFGAATAGAIRAIPIGVIAAGLLVDRVGLGAVIAAVASRIRRRHPGTRHRVGVRRAAPQRPPDAGGASGGDGLWHTVRETPNSRGKVRPAIGTAGARSALIAGRALPRGSVGPSATPRYVGGVLFADGLECSGFGT